MGAEILDARPFILPLFTEVRGETVWKSGIGPEWGSESGQEEWKESPFGCILSPQRRAPDALGYFPNSFWRGILGSSLAGSCIAPVL
jgi:hypothetical protein